MRKYVSMKLMPVYSFLTRTCARCGRGVGREGRRGLFRCLVPRRSLVGGTRASA